jgi:uncharacterized membrane protein/thiol-disulfide isomerase/thioredoxin
MNLLIVLCLSGSLFSGRTPVRAVSAAPVVHAVVFTSPTCSFCREIVEQELPPIQETFGAQLVFFFVDVDTTEGKVLYERFVDQYGVSGVPLVLVGDSVLGGTNIPKQLPDRIRQLLNEDGTDWPDLPGLQEYMDSVNSEAERTLTGNVVLLSPSEAPASSPGVPQSNASSGVVRAILFFSPVCGHCHIVMTEDLPPLLETYGSNLEILAVDITTEEGYAAFGFVVDHYQLDYAGVPFLVVGDVYLMGGVDIPEQFPGLIANYLAQGGVDWPDIPGLRETLGLTAEPAAGTSPATAIPALPAVSGDTQISWIDNVARDPVGNALSILVLAGMLVTLIAASAVVSLSPPAAAGHRPLWLLPLLCAVGLVVAGYLSYVELTSTEAICGPVGDCNTVQQSEYARLFGILPIGVLGIAGYIAILAVRMGGLILKGRWLALSDLGIFAMGAFGFLFSIYLTYLEPFVIGATCAWCLSSAVLMTVIFWLSLKPGLAAARDLAALLPLRRKG